MNRKVAEYIVKESETLHEYQGEGPIEKITLTLYEYQGEGPIEKITLTLYEYQGEDTSLGIWLSEAPFTVAYLPARSIMSNTGDGFNIQHLTIGHNIKPNMMMDCYLHIGRPAYGYKTFHMLETTTNSLLTDTSDKVEELADGLAKINAGAGGPHITSALDSVGEEARQEAPPRPETPSLHEQRNALDSAWSKDVGPLGPWAKDGNAPDKELPSFKSCAVIGSGGVLLDYDHGAEIDSHDAIFRINRAPTVGFERHVGSKTTFRVSFAPHCETGLAMHDLTHTVCNTAGAVGGQNGMMAKTNALNWGLRNGDLMAHAKRYPSYGKAIAKTSTLKLPDTPRFFVMDSNMIKDLRSHKIMAPTGGLLAVRIALQACDSVDIYGFTAGKALSTNKNVKGIKYHYYDQFKLPGLGLAGTKQDKPNLHTYSPEYTYLKSLMDSEKVVDRTGYSTEKS